MSSANTSKSTVMQANTLWSKQAKTNAEFFALTYGALVAELVRDLEDANKITEELDRMGHSMGVRCIEEVLAKASAETLPQSFSESPEILKIAFRMFLGIVVDAKTISDTSYAIAFADNPLAIFVELPPDDHHNRAPLEYSQLLAGLCRGMLEMLQFDCACAVSSTVLRGGETNEILVSLKQVLQDGAGEDYQEE